MAETEKYTPYRAGHGFVQNAEKTFIKSPERYAQYRKQYEDWPRERILGNFPTHIDLELASACNLHCPMCHTVYIQDPSFKKFKEQRVTESLMSMDLYKKAIDEATSYEQFFSIKLNYRGESTLHPDLVPMVQYAKEKGVFDIMLNTNGNYDTSMNKALVDAGLTWISFSLDAINPETYKRVRAGGNFYQAYSTALDMCRFADKLNVQISFVKQKLNNDETELFKQFWKQTAVHKIVVSDFYNPGELIKNESAFVVVNYQKLDKFCCPQLWQRILIWNDGKMFPCCHSFEGPDDLYLGNMNEMTIKEAWDSEKLKNIRDIHEAGDYQKIGTCSKCAYPKKPIQLSIDNIVGGI